MTINSRAKGCRGEKLVIEKIRPWWAQLEPMVEFARTPLSGGWQGRGQRGQSLRGEMRMSGDLMTTSHRFPFSVEVKNNSNWTLRRIEAGKSSCVWDWWIQCQTAADESKQVPMLWFRHARKPWLVMLPFVYATKVPILPPKLCWSPRELMGINYGEMLPILFDSEVVLKVNPLMFALKGRSRCA